MPRPPLDFRAPAGKLYVNGRWVEPANGQTMDVLDPATGEAFAKCALATEPDVSRAVEAARVAFEDKAWSSLSGKDRAVILRRIGAGVAARAAALAAIESADMGKPLRESDWDIGDVTACFDYYAGLAERLDEEGYTPVTDLPDDFSPKFSAETRRVPVGVVAAITPWNYPLLMASWKVAPALAAGCAVILKPSELSPLTCLELADIIDKEAQLPPGIFQVIVGTGVDCGAPLSAHAGIDKVGFTGSVATGRRILHASADSDLIKNVSLELGGKSPFLVFEDCDIDEAAEWIAFGVFWTNGQICSSTSRLLIHEDVADAVLKRVVEVARSIHVGDPFTEDNPSMGPLVSRDQQQKVLGFIASARAEGATVLTGGDAPSSDECKNGYFVSPTVLSNVTENMRVWNEEIFGPVLSAMTFKNEDEAIAIANKNEFGLAAAVLSKDEARLTRVSRALRAGIVWMNCSQPAFVQTPWGGFKNSGNGTRDLGPWGLSSYLETQSFVQYKAPPGEWEWFIKKSKL